MTDDDRKFLTEAMGECWHEPNRPCAVGSMLITGGTIKQHCTVCGKMMSNSFQLYLENRTFTTWTDFGAVWEWAQKQEWFDELFCSVCMNPKCYCEVHVPAAHVDPLRFPQLVVEFLKEHKL